MIQVEVDLGSRSYPILIGRGLLGDRDLMRRYVASKQVLIVSNETVGPLFLPQVRDALADRSVRTLLLPDGEQYKTLASFEAILSTLLEARFERGCTIVALGGGVVGDVAGFAAACYQRGVDFVQVPTTLLAQVDSSVGGKTAINHPLGKNMIGAFHQPRAVIADLATLDSLPPREFRAGMAEVIKYGLIDDPDFLAWLDENLESVLARDAAALAHAVEVSCRDKARIVGLDEREAGPRALLNLGHTFGHAIEHAMGYGEWLHGEAVAAGMCMAAAMSARIGLLPEADALRVRKLVTRAGLPVAPLPKLSATALLEAMRIDKKNKDGRIRLVLMQGLAHAVLVDDYPDDALQVTLAARE